MDVGLLFKICRDVWCTMMYYVYFQESKHVKALKDEELHPFCFFEVGYADSNLTL